MTEGLKHLSSPALLTTRAAAAALCDLERWDEAKRAVSAALAMGKVDPEAFNVVSRIKSARPDLYRAVPQSSL